MRILAVDDDPVFTELLRGMISQVGQHEVINAQSADEAVARIAESDRPFDCFLHDIQMPGMNGIGLTRVVRSMPEYSDAPIIMITAVNDRQHIDEAFSAGAFDYLTKPIDLQQITGRLGTVERLVQDRRRLKHVTSELTYAQDQQFDELTFEEPLPLEQSEGVMTLMALEHYLLRLGRFRSMGFSAATIAIENGQQLFWELSSPDFVDVLNDVAATIFDELKTYDFRLAYAGEGEFICMLPRAAMIDVDELALRLNAGLSALHQDLGTPSQHIPRVGVGPFVRTGLTLSDPVQSLLKRAKKAAHRQRKSVKSAA